MEIEYTFDDWNGLYGTLHADIQIHKTADNFDAHNEMGTMSTYASTSTEVIVFSACVVIDQIADKPCKPIQFDITPEMVEQIISHDAMIDRFADCI